MELNKDCIRDVLLQCEKQLEMTDDGVMEPLNLEVLKKSLHNYTDATIKYTVKHLGEAGLLDARIDNAMGITVLDFYIFDITYSGHELLNNIKSNDNWNKIKNIASKIGTSSLNGLSKIAISIITSQINGLIDGGNL